MDRSCVTQTQIRVQHVKSAQVWVLSRFDRVDLCLSVSFRK